MPGLPLLQRRAGRELGSRSVVADSKQTLLCTYLSAVLLVGLALNSLIGWSWADPIAALVIAGVAVKEGLQAWRGDSCACGPAAALHSETGQADDSCGWGPGCADACCTDTGGATKSGDGNSAAPLLTIGPRPESSPDRK